MKGWTKQKMLHLINGFCNKEWDQGKRLSDTEVACLKGSWSSVWISIGQSLMVTGIAYVIMRFMVRDWSWAVEFTNYGGPTGDGQLQWFNYLVSLKIGWKESICVRMTPVKSFLYQTTHSKVMIEFCIMYVQTHNRCNRMLDFFATEIRFGHDRSDPKKYFHFRWRFAIESTRIELRDRK